MKLGVQCEGCRMWTRVIGHYNMSINYLGHSEPYYCDECESKITWNTTKARLNL